MYMIVGGGGGGGGGGIRYLCCHLMANGTLHAGPVSSAQGPAAGTASTSRARLTCNMYGISYFLDAYTRAQTQFKGLGECVRTHVLGNLYRH